MKCMLLTAALVYCGLASAVGAEPSRQAADEAAIRKAVESYVVAFNQGDAKALAAMWLPAAVYTNPLSGEQVVGREEGIISGTFSNSATSQTQTIEGMADKATQRVAWTVAGKTRPIMETGISNLTEDTAPALVHFADGQTQQWLMVRLEEPASK